MSANNNNTNAAVAAPSHFCCPITLLPMDDPVIAPDGQTYERSALLHWATSQEAQGVVPPRLPTTNLPFTVADLVPNRGLKDAIDAWRAAGGRNGGGAFAVTMAGTGGEESKATASTHSAVPLVKGAQQPATGPLPLEVIPITRYYANPSQTALVAIAPPTGPRRRLHVVVVVDVSGSMGTSATMKDEDGSTAEFSNSVLDLVLYAAKAVANMLTEGDSFSLVTFTTSAMKVLSNVAIPAAGGDGHKAVMGRIERALSALEPDANTNLGDGLRLALETVVEAYQQDGQQQRSNNNDAAAPEEGINANATPRLNCVMMLTDGQPNHGPVALNVLNTYRRNTKPLLPSGGADAFQKPTSTTAPSSSSSSLLAPTTIGDLIAAHTIVNTFAFGYSSGSADGLASGLMYDVATLGNGTFGYIPDISFLGTQFIHCLANMRMVASVAAGAGLEVSGDEAEPTTAFSSAINYPHRVGLWTVQYGQTGFSVRPSGAVAKAKRGGGGGGEGEGDGAAEGWHIDVNSIDFTTPLNKDRLIALGVAVKDLAATPAEIAAVHTQIPAVMVGHATAHALALGLRGPNGVGPFDCEYDMTGVRIDRGAKHTATPKSKQEALAMLMAALPADSSSATGKATDALPGLLEDITDQLATAFEPKYFCRWGRHYLYSWLSATEHRVCNNFKDQSVRYYKTPMLSRVHDEYDDIFNMLPPPAPTRAAAPPQPQAIMSRNTSARCAVGGAAMASMSASSGAPMARRSKAITSTRAINSSHNPCVHEAAKVMMGDGASVKEARMVRHGDVVRLAGGGPTSDISNYTAVVDRVIRTQCLDGVAQLVRFPPRSHGASADGAEDTNGGGGLLITPWHPVWVPHEDHEKDEEGIINAANRARQWVLPIATGHPVVTVPCDHVYSFTVKGVKKVRTAAEGGAHNDAESGLAPLPTPHQPALIIDGVPVVYLGHGHTSSASSGSDVAVLAHPFFGDKEALTAPLRQSYPHHYHHEFMPEPILKKTKRDMLMADDDEEEANAIIAAGWDMNKYVGTW